MMRKYVNTGGSKGPVDFSYLGLQNSLKFLLERSMVTCCEIDKQDREGVMILVAIHRKFVGQCMIATDSYTKLPSEAT